jgi:hypothetical protein
MAQREMYDHKVTTQQHECRMYEDHSPITPKHNNSSTIAGMYAVYP